jgi:2-oxo-3-hexenedioate decarboxylase
MTKNAITGAATDSATIRKIADEAFTALNRSGGHVLPFSTRYPAFSMDDAYRVTALVNNMRVAQRYKPLGRKIGFTNRRTWDEYGIHAPIWGYVYDRTMQDLAVPLPLAPYTEPKIEPEIIFGFVVAPSRDMDDAALLSCVAWVAHGFEIAQSIFPDWKFSAADTVVANAMQLMDRGHPSNVLGGLLSAVRHLVELLSRDPDNLPLAAGEIVASGTLTRALPVKAGETWTTKLNGIGLEGISLRFC